MEGLLTLLLCAAFFYFMMRFGCGAHAVHGHGASGQHAHAGHGGRPGPVEHVAPSRRARAIDPVCGMEVAPDQGCTTTRAGREYRLCSRACLDKFEASPDRYEPAHGGAR